MKPVELKPQKINNNNNNNRIPNSMNKPQNGNQLPRNIQSPTYKTTNSHQLTRIHEP